MSDINLTGAIQNTVGSTIIKNQRGNINATNPDEVVWTNTMDIEATGSVGAALASEYFINLELIESADQASGTLNPIELTAVATTGSLNLDITARRRDGNTGVLTVTIQKLSAGENLNVILEQSMQDPGSTVPSAATVAAQNLGQPAQVDPHNYESFFYPDAAGPPPDPAVFVNLAAATTIAETDFQFGFAANGNPTSNPGLTAGGNINVEAADPAPAAPAIFILGTTDLTGTTGFINTMTNGSITYTESGGGAMRIGTISSTSGSVLLSNPALASPGQDIDLVQNNLDEGLISAATAILLNVGDNLTTVGNSSSTGSVLTAGRSITINLGYSPGSGPHPSAGSTVNIDGFISSPVTRIAGGSHDDVINLNFAHGINSTATSVVSASQLLTAIVDVDGHGGQNSLKVDDSGYHLGDSGVMTGTEINGLGMGGYGIHYLNIQQSLEIDLGGNVPPVMNPSVILPTNAPNAFTVLATVCPTTVQGGAGTDNLAIGAAINTATTVNEDFSLNGVDPSIPLSASHDGLVPADDGDLNRIKGALTFIGNGGTDTMEVNDLYQRRWPE